MAESQSSINSSASTIPYSEISHLNPDFVNELEDVNRLFFQYDDNEQLSNTNVEHELQDDDDDDINDDDANEEEERDDYEKVDND